MRIPTSHGTSLGFDQRTMTPLIDIVFQLLIFFICASTGHVREEQLPLDLNAAGSTAEAPLDKPLGEVWVRLTRDGDATVIQVEGVSSTDLAEIRGVLTSLAGVAIDVPVILDIDPQVPVGDVVAVYDLCRQAGFLQLSFAADPARGAAVHPPARNE